MAYHMGQLGRQSHKHKSFNNVNIKYRSYRNYIRVMTRWGDSKRRAVL